MSIQKLRTIIFIVFLGCVFFTGYSQNLPFDPDSILVGRRKQPEILLVGSFHFAYYNLDVHKTSKDKQVDIFSVQKQKEIQELLEYIYKFKPTKIAVETSSRNAGKIMDKYRACSEGQRALSKDEIEQLGFRLIDKFQLDTIYGVDDHPLLDDLYDGQDSLVFRPLLDSIYEGYDFKSDEAISKLYAEYYKKDDQLVLQIPLLEYFKYNNSDKVLDRGFGAYLTGDFTLGGTRGADALSLHWYNRNLRIYRYIQQITTSPEDRILVLFGQGHIQILKHLFQCSPEYKLIKFNELN